MTSSMTLSPCTQPGDIRMGRMAPTFHRRLSACVRRSAKCTIRALGTEAGLLKKEKRRAERRRDARKVSRMEARCACGKKRYCWIACTRVVVRRLGRSSETDARCIELLQRNFVRMLVNAREVDDSYRPSMFNGQIDNGSVPFA